MTTKTRQVSKAAKTALKFLLPQKRKPKKRAPIAPTCLNCGGHLAEDSLDDRVCDNCNDSHDYERDIDVNLD